MTITHHPSEATQLAYAAGSLDEGLAVVVATHLATCPGCRQAIRVSEAVGGQLLAALEGEAMAADALSHALARLDTPVVARRAPGFAREARGFAPAGIGFPLPHALRPYRLGNWRWIAPGVRHIRVLARRSGRSGLHLLRISPGTAMPGHGHEGNELTCILTGSYTDETGRFQAGDLVEMDTELEHRPMADARDGCICLIATDGRLRFHSLLPRLLQPILGF